jgi:hypothetical protein
LLNKIDYPSLYGSDRVFKRANTEDAVVGNRSTGKPGPLLLRGGLKLTGMQLLIGIRD